MLDITIPPEAVEAVRKWMKAPMLSDAWLSEMLAVAIKAWPGVHLHEWQRPWLGGMSGTDIILPLPQEPRDE